MSDQHQAVRVVDREKSRRSRRQRMAARRVAIDAEELGAAGDEAAGSPRRALMLLR